MELPKRTITFIDTQDKKYVLPVKLIAGYKLESFLQHAPPCEKDSTSDDAIFKLPDSPDAVEMMAHALQHGKFHHFQHWEDRRVILGNLLDIVRVGEKYHLHDMAHRAADLFDDCVKLHDDYYPTIKYGYADFADAVAALYRPVMPEGWQTMTPGELFFSRCAPSPDSYIPLLKRYVVQYAADHYYEIAVEDDDSENDDCEDDDCLLDLFGEDDFMYPEGLHPFHKDVQKAMKRQKDVRTKSKGKKAEMDENDWSDFFADERYVTLVDRKNRRYVLTRQDVLEQSKFLYECAPQAWTQKHDIEHGFVNETFELPDHPHGIRAVAAMIDDGARYFDVPDDVQAKDLSVQYLARALVTGDKYGVFDMRDAVNGLLGSVDYIARCGKPSTIVDAVKTVYTLKQHGKNDTLLRELKDKFVEWAVERGEGSNESAFESASSRACKKVPAFKADVQKAEEKKRPAAEEGGKGGGVDVDSSSVKEDVASDSEDSDGSVEEDLDGSAWEDMASDSEEDSDSGSVEEDSDSNAGDGVDDEET